MSAFRVQLEELINRYSKEVTSNTPDFILAEYLYRCLQNFNSVTVALDVSETLAIIDFINHSMLNLKNALQERERWNIVRAQHKVGNSVNIYDDVENDSKCS